MAERKRYQKAPVLDNSAVTADPSLEKSKVSVMLPPNHFNNLIRVIKNSHLEVVTQIRNITFHALRRLGVERDTELTFVGLPAGSDQVDIQTFKRWTDKIKVTDKKAVHQLKRIDATAVARSQ